MNAGFIIAGTDTGVGKTVIAAGLAQALEAAYWKPVQAGLADETDSAAVSRLTGGGVSVLPEAFRLATPCSPHAAAGIDGVRITAQALALPRSERLIVEGAGGVLSPLADDLLPADLFARWGLPVILVATTRLGTINHSLLSLEALRARGIAVAGVIFSGAAEPVCEDAIVRLGKCRHLGRLPHLDPLDAGTLAQGFAGHIATNLLT